MAGQIGDGRSRAFAECIGGDQVRIRCRRGRAGHVRVRPEIPGGILRTDDIAVTGVRGQTGICERRAGDERAKFGEPGAAGALTTFDAVSRHADVVGCRAP